MNRELGGLTPARPHQWPLWSHQESEEEVMELSCRQRRRLFGRVCMEINERVDKTNDGSWICSKIHVVSGLMPCSCDS